MIIIKNQVNNEYNIRASDIKDGRAYMTRYGQLFVGNSISHPTDRIKAFSVDGAHLIWENDTELFMEVNIEVIVKGYTVE